MAPGRTSILPASRTGRSVRAGEPASTTIGRTPTTALPNPKPFAQGVADLIEVVKRLETLGVSKAGDIDLPKVVVVGDQSAGKSSLIEAFSKIKVPRNEGTCTRAPLQIHLSSGPTWHCRVELVEKYELHGDADAVACEEYFPWVRKRNESCSHFATSDRPEDLQNILEDAQNALLGNAAMHDLDSDFMDDTIGQLAIAQQFSPNTVRLHLQSPGSPHLSFTDLPGIINQTENPEDKHLVKLVRTIVENYIRDTSAIVVLAISMEGDAHTSTAASIMRDIEGAEARTIGVLTKPDRRAQGTKFDIWKGMLNDKKFQLGHGYFVTRQPNQEELARNISHDEARQLEDDFFRTNPWNTDLFNLNNRFGTRALKLKLSELLTSKIHECLPDITAKVDGKINDIKADLNKIAPPTQMNEARHIMMECLNIFQQQFHYDIHQSVSSDFRVKWNRHRENFKKQIDFLVPKMGDEASVDSKVPATPKMPAKRPFEAISEGTTPSMKRERLVEPSSGSSRGPVQRGSEPGSANKTITPKVFQLEQVREVLNRHSSNNVPGQLDPRAIEQLVLKNLDQWVYPMYNLLELASKAVLRTAEKALQQGLDEYGYEDTEFGREARRRLKKFLKNQENAQKSFLEQLLAVETFAQFTMSEQHKIYIARRKEKLMEQRHQNRVEALLADEARKTENLERSAFNKKDIQSDAWLRKHFATDPYDQEVGALAEVQAYYTVASRRFVDNVVASINAQLFHFTDVNIGEWMKGTIARDANGKVDPQRCAEMIEHDPTKAAERLQLDQDLRTFEMAKASLEDLNRRHLGE